MNMNMLLIGVMINTMLFGYMAFTNEKMGISHKVPQFLLNPILNTILTFLYPLSFVFILFVPGGLIKNIIVCLLLQFIINHIVWGSIVGIISGIGSRKVVKDLNSKYGINI